MWMRTKEQINKLLLLTNKSIQMNRLEAKIKLIKFPNLLKRTKMSNIVSFMCILVTDSMHQQWRRSHSSACNNGGDKRYKKHVQRRDYIRTNHSWSWLISFKIQKVKVAIHMYARMYVSGKRVKNLLDC